MGGLDVVINNAGIGAQGTVEANEIDEWRHVLDVNVLGMVRVTRAALPHLRKSDKAAIVNTCSIVATAGLPERALYSASKGAVLSLTLAMAADHLREGIRVNCVNPGTADTPWIGRLLSKAPDPAAERAALEARQPSGRLVSADEVADAVLYLASPAASAHDRDGAGRRRRHAGPAPATEVVSAAALARPPLLPLHDADGRAAITLVGLHAGGLHRGAEVVLDPGRSPATRLGRPERHVADVIAGPSRRPSGSGWLAPWLKPRLA